MLVHAVIVQETKNAAWDTEFRCKMDNLQPKEDLIEDRMTEFKDLLTNYLQHLEGLRVKRASEDTIRAAFLKFLSDAFPRIDADEFDLERSISLSSHGAGAIVRYGFADAVYGDLIFEFKRTLDAASIAKGESELEKYIKAQYEPESRFGLLTEGQNVRVYALRDAKFQLLDTFILALLIQKTQNYALILISSRRMGYLLLPKILRSVLVSDLPCFGEVCVYCALYGAWCVNNQPRVQNLHNGKIYWL